MAPVPSKFCSLLIYRHFTVSTKICSIGRNNKQNLMRKRIEAFPPIFKTQLKQWPHLLQWEIDHSNSDKKELLTECGDWSQLEKRGLGVGNLRLLSDSFHPMNGRMIILRNTTSNMWNRKNKALKIGAPVSICVAKNNGQLQPVTDCVLLEFDNKDIAVKVRRSSRSVVLGGDTDYAIISSDISGALHSLKNFFKNGMLKKSPGEKLIEYAFRGQQMPSIHNDRMISSISEELNEIQRRSVAAALNKKRPFVNIQGPPGTGKTKVVVEIIRQLMMQGQKVLICAPTNVAVDHIMNKTVQSLQGSEVYSHCKGAELDINATILNTDCFHDSFASHPYYEELTNICKELEIAHSNRTSLLSRVSVLKRSILKDCYKNRLLVFCTLTSSTINHLSMANWLPEVIIIDEAAQCIEPAAWPAIVRAKRCIMAGDQAQLPAIVKSPEAFKKKLDISLMERLSKEFSSANINHLLTVQYRMNSKIMRWSSDQFYKSLLTADESVANITLSDISNISSNHSLCSPLIMLNTDLDTNSGCSYEEMSHLMSYFNTGEVNLVIRYLEFLQKIGVQEKDIGIITPYYAQVEMIREKILGSQIVVNTVDAFQGQEKEVIIFSMVRHNPERSIGFLREERRLNVAITRARRQFVLIGSARMTERNKCLKKLFTSIKRNGIVVSPTDMDELGYEWDTMHINTEIKKNIKS